MRCNWLLRMVLASVLALGFGAVLGPEVGLQEFQAQGQTATGATQPDPEDGLFLNIGSAGVRRIKLALPILSGAVGTGEKALRGDLDEEVISKFRRLFDFTLAFDIANEKSMPSSAAAYAVPLPYDRWKGLGFELVLHGVVEKGAGGSRSIEFRLYDVNKQKRLLGKKFSQVTAANLDEVVKRFADLSMKALTGQLGIFSTKLAFVGTPRGAKSKEVFISDFDGQNLVQVTNDGVPHMSPSWSPDGSKLTYTSFKNGRAEIHIYNLLTKKSYKLSRGRGNTSGAAWHPSGRTIAFSQSLKGKTSIYTMRSFDGSGTKPLISGSGLEVEPAYSPNGKFLAFASGRFGNPHLFVRNLSTNKDTRITFAGWYNSSPSWRPDGKKLAFAGYDRDIDRYDIFSVNPDGRQLERLTLDRGDNENPTFSPDGRFIMFQSNRVDGGGKGKQSSYRMFIMTKDGAGQRPLQIPLKSVTMPEWSPYLTGL